MPRPRRPGAGRRHGRVRRWLVRPLVWAVALLALASLALSLAARSRWVEERAARWVVGYLEAKLGAAVELEALHFDLLPLAVEARGLTIGSGGSDILPLARVSRIVVEADLEAFLAPSVRLRRVTVEEPAVSLRWLEAGGDNMVRWRRRRSPRRGPPLPFQLSIDVVELSRGTLWLEERRLPLEAQATGVNARLAGVPGAALEGSVRAASLVADLPRGRAEVDSFSARARFERGRIELIDGRATAPGLVADLTGTYLWGGGERELMLDVEARAAAAIANRWEVFGPQISGPLELTGGLAWQPQVWGFRGTVTSPSLRLFDRSLDGVVAVVSVDRNGGRVDLETAGYGAGSLSGQVTVGSRDEGRAVEVDLQLEEVRLSRLLADQNIPISGVEGRVTGGFVYRFLPGAPEQGDGWADLAVSPGSAPGAGVLAVRGSIPLTIAAGTVSTRAARLISDSQELMGGGSYRLAEGQGEFDYVIVTERVEELVERLPLGGDGEEPRPGWLPSAGRGRLEGTLWLERGEAATDLRLDLFDVAAEGYAADRARGSLRVSSRAVERLWLELLRPDAALLVVGEPAVAESGELALTLDAEAWPLEDLRYWLPGRVAASGRVAGHLELGGRPEALVGELRVTSRPFELGGITAEQLHLAASFGGGRTEVREATVVSAAGTSRLEGSLDDVAGIRLALSSEPLDLARPPFSELAAGGLAGALRLSGRIDGSWSDPRVELRLEGSGVEVAGEALGAAAADFRWRQGRLAAEGSLLGLVRFEGGGRLDRDAAALELAVESDRLSTLGRWLLPDSLPPIEGSAAGRLSLAAAAPFADPELRLELESLEARTGEHSLANLEPVVIEARREAVTVNSLWLGEPGGASELFVAGRLLTAGGALDLTVQSTLDSDWLTALVPGVDLRGGSFDAIARVAGTPAAPRINGVGRVDGIRALIDGLPSSFEEVVAVLLFDPGELVIDRSEARFAGGRVRLGGRVSVEQSWQSPGYRLQLSAEGLNLRYPEGWLLRGGGRASISSTPGGRLVSGSVELERATYRQPVELGLTPLLRALFGRERVEVEETSELLATTQIHLDVRAPDALRVRNNVADLEGSAELSIRGSLARPVLFGRVELEPGGELTYAGSEYVVERGLLTFANPYRIEPVVDLTARTELREYDVVLNLTGTPDRLQVGFSSDPPLADLEVLSLLTSGETRRRPQQGEGAVGAEGFLYGQAASLLTERANLLFGLDKLRIDPLTGESGDLSSARVTLGKRLSSDLFATYSYDPSTTEEEILELRWNVSGALQMLVTQNGDGTYAVDFLWEKAF